MLSRSRIISGASAIAGEPPNEPLPGGVPEHLRFETCADIETELIRDLNLSTENRTIASTPIHLTGDSQDFALPGGLAVETPAFVSLSSANADPNFPNFPESLDIEITNLSLLNDAYQDGKRKVAFYGD